MQHAAVQEGTRIALLNSGPKPDEIAAKVSTEKNGKGQAAAYLAGFGVSAACRHVSALGYYVSL